MTIATRVSLVLAVVLFSTTIGCGSGSTVSGKATFQGEPIPIGTIQFIPPGEGGAVQAQIKQGSYTTENALQPGTYKVMLDGYDGVAPQGAFAPNGTALFHTYRTKVEVQGGESNLDFDVPAPAAEAK